MKYVNLLVSCICLLIFRLEITLAYASTNPKNNDPSPSIIKQAQELQIQPNVLMELWNSKQPVIMTKSDASGQITRTTYDLSPDCSEIIKSVAIDNLPANLEQSSQKNQPISQQNSQQDWEYLPSSQTRRVSNPSYQPPTTFGENFGNTFGANWPDFNAAFPTLSHNWPSFSIPAGVVPETSRKTEIDDQGRTVTTTTKIYRTSSNPNQDQFNLFNLPMPSWLQPNPVRPRLGTNVNQGGEPSYVAKIPPVTTVQPTKVPLPTVAPTYPSSRNPITTTPLPSIYEVRRQQNARNNPVSRDNPRGTNINNSPSTQTQTRRTTYTINFSGDSSPKISNLDRSVQDMLARAGITEEDIRNAPPTGIIEKTYTNPDGHVITTRLRLNSSPSELPTTPLPFVPLPTFRPYATLITTPKDKSIENYLSQVNLSPSDILSRNGEVVKTIVDKDGRVLSATFVLSTVKGSENSEQSPTK